MISACMCNLLYLCITLSVCVFSLQILFADEKELNKWVSLKKVTAYQYAIYQFGFIAL